jgi:hypothetical protein
MNPMAEVSVGHENSSSTPEPERVCVLQSKGEIMLKAICKNMVWMAVPLSLALGCASNRTNTEASYAPAATLTPTSGEPEQRIYSTFDPGTVSASEDIDAPPAGANAQNWQVAEAIREKMTQDQSLAPMGSSLIAEVGKDGTVTLKGRVSSPSEKDRVKETISSVPGVKGVNDDSLGIGRSTGNGEVDLTK